MVPRFSDRRTRAIQPLSAHKQALPRPLSWFLILSLVFTPLAGLLAMPAAAHAAPAQAPIAQDNAEPGDVGSTEFTLPPSDMAEVAQTTTTDQEIIYIDNNGTIHVLDPYVPAGRVQIRWSSPTNGWQHFAIGDVNGDGDDEIVAISENAGLIRLAVFDPVVASGAISDQGGSLDGVPWDVLYEGNFTGAAPVVTVGNFDRAILADEIFIGFRSFSGGFRAIILNAEGDSINPSTQRPSGRAWKSHVDQILDVPFSYASSGDITNNGLDEIVLVEASDLNDAAFRVYEAENNFRLIDRFGRSNSSMFHAAVGNVIPGGGAEVVASSSASNRNNLFVVQLQANGQLSVGENQYQFVPSPRYVFLADLTGNGDKEVFFMREYGGTDRDRLIMRNEWGNDTSDTATFEVRLDNDNGYKVGAGGDYNGNGREEIAIMRDDRIRLYLEPVRGPSSYTDFNVSTNSRSIAFANVDAIGFIQGPQITVSPSNLTATVEYGANVSIGQIAITNFSTSEAVQVSAQALNPNGTVAGFVSFTPATGTTPATLGVRFNATNLREGVYTGVIRITSPNQNVVNLPQEIPFSVTVLPPPPPGFNPSAGGTGFFYYPCSEYFAMLDNEEPEPAAVDLSAEDGSVDIQEYLGTRTATTLNEPTMPQTVTVRFTDTPGATGGRGNVTMAVVAAPSSAGTAENGDANEYIASLSDAYVDHNGNVVLVDAQGQRTLVEMPGAGTAAVDQMSWPSLVPWVRSVTSDSDEIPLTVTLVGDLAPVIQDMETEPSYIHRSAILVVVGDSTYGAPPRNVRIVSLSLVCTNTFLGMPAIRR